MKKKLLLLPLLALGLTACGPTDVSSSGPSSSEEPDSSLSSPSTPDSTPDTPSSSTPIIDTYRVILPTDTRYTISANKTEAKEGEEVEITVTPVSGYTVLTVKAGGIEATKKGDKYVFNMPDHDVRVTVTLDVKGEVTISGDIAAVLVKDDKTGIYSAKNVRVESKSNFGVFVEGNGGTKTSLGISHVDRTKCFADISYSGSKDDYGLSLQGGGIYDFFYDPSNGDRPIYIKRVELINLPNNPASLHKLFSGSVQSDPAVYPDNVKHVTYTNSQLDVKYDWKKYEDDKSLAKVVALTDDTDEVGVVYKELKDGIFTMVDTYIENEDPTKNEGLEPYSGKYLVSDTNTVTGDEVDSQQFDTSRQFIHPMMSGFEVNNYSHDMESIDFDIMYAYRVQMTVADEIIQASCKIESKDNGDETFTTTIVSSSTYDSTAVTANNPSNVVKYHDDYEVSLTFTKAGAILNGTYKDTYYDQNAYDFKNFVPIGKGKIKKRLTFSYEYGDAYTGAVDFDKTPYFVSSINPVIAESADAETSIVDIGENPEDKLHLNASPSTALDKWQFGIRESSDTSVIDYNANYRKWFAKADGDTNVTISNLTTKDVKATIPVKVGFTRPIRKFSLILSFGYDGWGDDGEMADQALVYEKHTRRYQLTAMGDDGKGSCGIPTDAKLTLSEDIPGLKVSIVDSIVNRSAKDVLFDATEMKIPEDGKKITMTVETSHYGKGCTPSSFSVYLFQTNYTLDDMVGTWTNAQVNGSLTLTKEVVTEDKAYYNKNNPTKTPYYGYVMKGSTKYEFSYNYLEASVNHDFTLYFGLRSLSNGRNMAFYSSMYFFEGRVDSEGNTLPDAIHLGLCAETYSYGEDSTYDDIFGIYQIDEEAYSWFDEYTSFTR